MNKNSTPKISNISISPNITFHARVISNILCVKEAMQNNRSVPKYGTIFLHISKIDSLPLPLVSKNQGKSRFVLEITYLNDEPDPNYLFLKKLQTNDLISLKVDPYAIFQKENFTAYDKGGYLNYSTSVIGNSQNISQLKNNLLQLVSKKPIISKITPEEIKDYIEQQKKEYQLKSKSQKQASANLMFAG